MQVPPHECQLAGGVAHNPTHHGETYEHASLYMLTSSPATLVTESWRLFHPQARAAVAGVGSSLDDALRAFRKEITWVPGTTEARPLRSIVQGGCILLSDSLEPFGNLDRVRECAATDGRLYLQVSKQQSNP